MEDDHEGEHEPTSESLVEHGTETLVTGHTNETLHSYISGSAFNKDIMSGSGDAGYVDSKHTTNGLFIWNSDTLEY